MAARPRGAGAPVALDDDLLLFAGGSGITPVASIVKSVLAAGRGSMVLIYANRDDDSIIFVDGLSRLAADHPGRLVVVHWLESVQGLPTAPALARPYADRDACACRITGGEVRMLNNNVLEDEDLDEGYILACQSLPVTDTVSVTYD